MASIRELAARVRLVIFDVDGVFTDGRLYYGSDGAELKAFHTRDGHGIKMLLKHGIQVAVISGRESAAVTRRVQELGIKYTFQGYDDKWPVYQQLLQQLAMPTQQVACVGDDLPDLPLMEASGLAIAVNDAHPTVRAGAHLCTQARGGEGAVREVCDLILTARTQPV